MLKTLRERAEFFRQFRRQFETTGSIAPSSRFLARAMTRYLRQRAEQPVRVLEIGPGTGAVTDEIVRHLRPGDSFDLVELNDAFVSILNGRFESETRWRAAASMSHVHQMPLQQFQPEEPYDFVISGLPFANFPADLVESLAEHYLKLVKPGGVISYFEYMYVRPVRKSVSWGRERERMARIHQIMEGYISSHRIKRDNIWINVPPAWVQHLQQSGESAQVNR